MSAASRRSTNQRLWVFPEHRSVDFVSDVTSTPAPWATTGSPAPPLWQAPPKSVLAESGVWVRLPSSAPSKIPILLGNSLGFQILLIGNSHARKRTKIPSSRQVFVK